MIRFTTLAMLLPIAFATVTSAQDRGDAPRAGQDPRFALTVYSTADPATFNPGGYDGLPGFGVVRELRTIDLQNGENTVRFTDVAGGIDPTTLAFRSLTAPNSTSVLEQSFEYDVLDSDKLLRKYIGKDVVILRRISDNQPPQPLEGKLLSAENSNIILQTSDPKQPVMILRDYSEIVGITLADAGGGLITKPTLVWLLSTNRAGRHDVQVTYQTDGLTWRADYNVVVSEQDTSVDIGAWVTLANQSGASYPNARLKLVAGDVQRLPRGGHVARFSGGGALMGGARDDGFVEKSFFEYHLYTLGRLTTLPNNSTKQIELFPTRSDVPITKTYVYYGLAPQFRTYYGNSANLDRNFGIESNKKVDIYLQLENSEKNGMGIPLPAGRVRVYKRDDADKSLEFVGEDVVQHTPTDEKVLVKLGSAFDVVGERKQTNFTTAADGHVVTESFEIKVRNHKNEPVTVIVKENLFRWSNWEITAGSDKHEKQDFRTIHIPVDVPPNGEKTITYTVRYTW